MVLSHHALVQNLLGVGESCAFFRLDVAHRDACHLRHHVPHGFLLQFLGHLGLLTFAVQRSHLVGNLGGRHGAVEQVESRRWQMAVGHVALGQTHDFGWHIVVDGQFVELLITFAFALDDVDGLFFGGFLHCDFLEESRQFLVFLYIFGVAVDGGGDEHLQLVFRQQFLQSWQNAVQRRLLVLHSVEILDDEQGLCLGQQGFGHFLEAVFNLALVTHALAQGDEVEFVGLQVFQRCWHLLVAQALQQGTDEAGLAHTCFAHDEDVGSVFAGQHFHYREHFLVEADDGSLRHVGEHGNAVFVGAAGGFRGSRAGLGRCACGGRLGWCARGDDALNLVGLQRQRLQLLITEADAGCDQRCQEALECHAVQSARVADFLGLLDDVLRVVREFDALHAVGRLFALLHAHVGPIHHVVVVLVERVLDERHQTHTLVEQGAEQVGWFNLRRLVVGRIRLCDVKQVDGKIL